MPANLQKNIILTGFSFTGKSSVAKLAASRLGWKPVDLDREIIKKTGKTIPEIFADEGEEAFRVRESCALSKICKEEKQVIATGGGVVLSEKNRRLLKRSGLVIWLEARPETIYHRLLEESGYSSSSEVRPLLAGKDPLAKITTLKQSRQACYEDAHITIHTDSLDVKAVTERVTEAWNTWNGYK
ncbi:shikimate kinase [Chloroflexota bacterium]